MKYLDRGSRISASAWVIGGSDRVLVREEIAEGSLSSTALTIEDHVDGSIVWLRFDDTLHFELPGMEDNLRRSNPGGGSLPEGTLGNGANSVVAAKADPSWDRIDISTLRRDKSSFKGLAPPLTARRCRRSGVLAEDDRSLERRFRAVGDILLGCSTGNSKTCSFESRETLDLGETLLSRKFKVSLKVGCASSRSKFKSSDEVAVASRERCPHRVQFQSGIVVEGETPSLGLGLSWISGGIRLVGGGIGW
jgi:hypothetical protein